MGSVSKIISITQIMEALTKDTQNPLDSSELDQIESVLSEFDYEVSNGDQQISYTPKTVPEDLVPILKVIKKRQEAKKIAT